MKKEKIITGDGSFSLRIPAWDEQYHSKHGAIKEAEHVFIEKGLTYYLTKNEPREVSILEFGFGTGLNTLLTYLKVKSSQIKVKYCAIEAFPLKNKEWKVLNYEEILGRDTTDSVLEKMHLMEWEKYVSLESNFALMKTRQYFESFQLKEKFDVLYFDAFGARVQPELWTEKIFEALFEVLNPNGVLVTYSSKGSVRRAMISVGFKVEKLPGPPGKREMLRAVKIE